jgi:FAD/FMN-containing dehydrogenase
LAVRSGGHCFAGRSSTSGVVVDVSPMSRIDVGSGTVTVGAGVRLGQLYDALAARGVAIPAGCGETVGISGLTLGGGIGILGRSHGLTCDSLTSANVVLAAGSAVHCDESSSSDLFWMLRGGGAPGVVTSLTFETVPAPTGTAVHLSWPFALAAPVLSAWQEWLASAPAAAAVSVVLSASGDLRRPPVVSVFGAVSDVPVEVLGGLVDRVGVEPTTLLLERGSHRSVKHALSGLDVHGGPEPEDGPLRLHDEYFRGPLPPFVVEALAAGFAAGRVSGVSRELDFNPLGGAYNAVSPGATAYPHRDALFLLKQSGTAWPGTSAADPWLDESYALTHPYGTGGAYPNFPDPTLVDEDRSYYLDNTERIQQVRRTYDPEGVFAPAYAAGRPN